MASIPERGQDLTPRELDVLNAFCGGSYTAKNVARKLGISHRTVEIHMGNLIVKVGAENQLHAVLMHDRTTRAAGLQRIADMDPAGIRADDLGRAASIARAALEAATPLPTHPQQEKL